MIHVSITVKGGGGRVIRDWTGTVAELAQLEPTLEHLGGLPFASRLTVTLKEDGKEPAIMTLQPGDHLGPVTATSGMLTGQPKLDEPPRPPQPPVGDPPVVKTIQTAPAPTHVMAPAPNPVHLLPIKTAFPPPRTSDQVLVEFGGYLQDALDQLEPTIRWVVSVAPRPSNLFTELQVHGDTGWGTIALPVRQFGLHWGADMRFVKAKAWEEADKIVLAARKYIAQVRVKQP